MSLKKLLILAPSRRTTSETFIRANLEGLPYKTCAYFGDEYSPLHPIRSTYAIAILISKILMRLKMLRMSGLPASLVGWMLIRLHKPDIVLVEFGFEAVRVMEACYWTRVPLVVHFRGADASAERWLTLLHQRYQRLFKIAAGVIVKSQPMASCLQALGASSDRMLVSASGANQNLFYGSTPKHSAPIFLAVGRFVEKKGPLYTIRAFAQMKEHDPTDSAYLWMVGDGPLMREATQLIDQLNLSQSVVLFGSQPQWKVASLMRHARAFVQHSMVASDGDSEGNPVAIMEAQLSGLPVIATRHAGIPEVVVDGLSGFLCDEKDEVTMSEAMLRVFDDSLLAQKLGEAGSNRIRRKFTVAKHLDDLSKFLESLALS